MDKEIRSNYEEHQGYWFAPKLFGWGATPVTWQGWVVTLGYVGLLMLELRLVEPRPAKIVIAVTLTVALIAISCRKTDGGCRWHWGLRK